MVTKKLATLNPGTNLVETSQLPMSDIAAVVAPAASTTVVGKVELATNAETTAGTDAVRAVTPAGLAVVTAAERATASSTYVSKAGGSVVAVGGAGVTGLVVQGAVGQTADLTQWQNSAGAMLANVSAAGSIQTVGYVNAALGLNSPSLQSPFGIGAYLDMNGNNAVIYNRTDAGNIPLLVVGMTGQTNSLQEWWNVGGNTVAAVAANGSWGKSAGGIGFYGTAPIVKQTGVAVTAGAIHAALVNLGLIAA